MLVVLLVGIALVVRATIEPRERIWMMALLVLWGITTARYVPWLGVLTILSGCAAISLVAYPMIVSSRNR